MIKKSRSLWLKIAFFSFFCLFLTTNSQADIIKIAGLGSLGVSYPGVNLDADTQGNGSDFAYSYGAAFYYVTPSFGEFIFATEYTRKPMSFYTLNEDISLRETFYYTGLDLSFLYRANVLKYLYFEIGLLYGYNLKDWGYKSREMGAFINVKQDIKEKEGVELANEFGYLFGIGTSYKITKRVTIELGMRARGGWTPVLKSVDVNLKTRFFSFYTAVAFTAF